MMIDCSQSVLVLFPDFSKELTTEQITTTGLDAVLGSYQWVRCTFTHFPNPRQYFLQSLSDWDVSNCIVHISFFKEVWTHLPLWVIHRDSSYFELLRNRTCHCGEADTVCHRLFGQHSLSHRDEKRIGAKSGGGGARPSRTFSPKLCQNIINSLLSRSTVSTRTSELSATTCAFLTTWWCLHFFCSVGDEKASSKICHAYFQWQILPGLRAPNEFHDIIHAHYDQYRHEASGHREVANTQSNVLVMIKRIGVPLDILQMDHWVPGSTSFLQIFQNIRTSLCSRKSSLQRAKHALCTPSVPLRTGYSNVCFIEKSLAIGHESSLGFVSFMSGLHEKGFKRCNFQGQGGESHVKLDVVSHLTACCAEKCSTIWRRACTSARYLLYVGLATTQDGCGISWRCDYASRRPFLQGVPWLQCQVKTNH